MSKFYITGLYHTGQLNDSTLPPIEVEASDQLDALTSIGATVWSEDEWNDLQKQCRNNPNAPKLLEPIRYGILR